MSKHAVSNKSLLHSAAVFSLILLQQNPFFEMKPIADGPFKTYSLLRMQGLTLDWLLDAKSLCVDLSQLAVSFIF